MEGISMFRKSLSRAAGLAAAIIFVTTIAAAQSTQVEGTVRLKAEDGSKKTVAGATVDIYRIDIKTHFDPPVKTDKNGHFVRLGLPVQGTYLFLVSAPGAAPTYMNNIRIAQMPVVDVVLDPGDGRVLTLDDVQKAVGGQQKSGGGSPAPKAAAPGDKAKADAAQKEYEAKIQESKEVQSTFDQARTHYNTGVEMMQASNYQNALSEFEQAATVDPTKHAAMTLLAYRSNANLAEAHYQIGVDLFNKKQRPEAKTHFEAAITGVKKALALASKDTAENNPNLNNDLVIYYNMLGKNAMLLIEYYGAANLLEDTVKELDKAETLDTVNKNKWGVLKADMYRSAGRSEEAVAAYKKVLAADPAYADALYGLGLTLIASSERAQIQEGANTLAEFLVKAPATDKRLPIVKSSLEELKNGLKIEAEKPASTKRGKKP
jgi:tetratricopeptide (TPR) repeat protein